MSYMMYYLSVYILIAIMCLLINIRYSTQIDTKFPILYQTLIVWPIIVIAALFSISVDGWGKFLTSERSSV